MQTANGQSRAGSKRSSFDEKSLAMTVEAGPVTWAMAPSEDDDVIVKSAGEEFPLSLASAEKITVTPYDTGYKTGVKVRLERFRNNGLLHRGRELDLALVLNDLPGRQGRRPGVRRRGDRA